MMRFLVFMLALLPAAALPSTVIPHSMLDRARLSDRVAVVQVLSIAKEQATLKGVARDKTVTRVAIGDEIKGRGPKEVVIVQLAGVIGDASFLVGETALVFLRCVTPSRCVLSALGAGKVAIDGDAAVVFDLFTNTWSRQPLKSVLSRLRSGSGANSRPPDTAGVP